jgi:hypothetical protein
MANSPFAIPAPGEPFLGDAPGVMKVARVTFGPAGDCASGLTAAQSASTCTEAVTLVNFEAGGFRIYDVQTRVITAFVAGTSLNLGIGGGDLDDILVTGDIGPTTAAANLMVSMLRNTSSSMATGYFTSVSGTIAITWQPGATDETQAGLLEVLVWYTYGIGGA